MVRYAAVLLAAVNVAHSSRHVITDLAHRIHAFALFKGVHSTHVVCQPLLVGVSLGGAWTARMPHVGVLNHNAHF